MGLNSIVIAVGPAIGPTVSGIIVNSLSWRWIFGVMAPLAAVILVLGIVFIKVPSANRRLPVDVFSVILSAFAFGGLVYAISTFGSVLDGPTVPLVSLVIGLAALALFITRQVHLTRIGRELLNLQPFANRTFTLSVAMIMIAMGTLLGTVVILPIFLQNGSGLSTMTIGMMLLPGGLIQIAVGPIFGRVFDRHGPRPVLIPGALMLALGQWLFTTIDPGTALGLIVAFHTIFCIGLAMLMTGLLSAALSDVPHHLYGHGSAIFNTGQQLGGAIGTTIFVTVMSAVAAAETTGGSELVDGLFHGARIAFIVGGILATIAVVCAPFIKCPEARGSASERRLGSFPRRAMTPWPPGRGSSRLTRSHAPVAEAGRLLPSMASPDSSAFSHVSVLLTAAKFEFSNVMRVSWTCWAGTLPCAFVRLTAPVESDRTSTATPIGSASAAVPRMQLLVM